MDGIVKVANRGAFTVADRNNAVVGRHRSAPVWEGDGRPAASRYGFRPSRIAFLALHAWGDKEARGWPPGFPPERRREYGLPEIRRERGRAARLGPVPGGPSLQYG